MSVPAFTPRNNAPWSFVRDHYQAGMTLSQLADLFHIPRTTIHARAIREGWKQPKPTHRPKHARIAYFDPDAHARLTLERTLRRALKKIDTMSDQQLVKNLPQLRHMTDVCVRLFGWNESQSTHRKANGRKPRGSSRSRPGYAHEEEPTGF